MIIVYEEVIIEVSANFLCGLHRSKDVKLLPVRERREHVGKHSALDAACHFELAFNSLAVSLFSVLQFHCVHTAADVKTDKEGRDCHCGKNYEDVEPSLLIESLFLDYGYCHGCSISYLRQFTNYYDRLSRGKQQDKKIDISSYTRDYPQLSNSAIVSDWEKGLYTALFDAGIKTIPQYPADRYSLDLALLQPNGRKLDIEIDGEMYHRNWNKELCYRDQLRNQRLFELGWDVKRFWVYQVRDDLSWCVQQVQDWYQKVKQE